jgi:steroid Delta-isomerase
VLDDTRIDAEGVFCYRVAEDGRILSLRAFWEMERAAATARPYDGDLPVPEPDRRNP